MAAHVRREQWWECVVSNPATNENEWAQERSDQYWSAGATPPDARGTLESSREI